MKTPFRKLAPVALGIVATSFLALPISGFGPKAFDDTIYYNGCQRIRFNGAWYPCSATNIPVTMGSDDNGVSSSLNASVVSGNQSQTANNLGRVEHIFSVPLTTPQQNPTVAEVLLTEYGASGASITTHKAGASAEGVGQILGVVAKAQGSGAYSEDEATSPAVGTRIHGYAPVQMQGPYDVQVPVLTSNMSGRAKIVVPSVPGNNAPVAAFAAGGASSRLVPEKGKAWTVPPTVIRSGGPSRPPTFFTIVRADNVSEPIHAFQPDANGDILFSGLGFSNTTLTIQLTQPGFLRQTSQRAVVNETLRSVSNPAVDSPLTMDLVFGDANGDNQITQADVTLINSYVGKSQTSFEWYERIPSTPLVGGQLPIRIADLDENLDGQITSADVNKAIANLGRTL